MKRKTLVMVDIQKEFEVQKGERLFGNLFIQKILEYIKKEEFTKLVWIVDANRETISIPSELYRLKQYISTELYWKNYAVMKVLPLEVLEEFMNKFMIEQSNKKAYIAKETETLFIKTENHHVFQEVTNEILEFIKSVRDDEINLIGGAAGECIQDIEKVLSYYCIDFQIVPELVYPVSYHDENIYAWDVRNSPNPKGEFFLF